MRRGNRSFHPGQYRRQTQTRLFIGGLGILLFVGGGLVWLLYGGPVALTTILCLLAAAGTAGLLWLVLVLLERWVKEDQP